MLPCDACGERAGLSLRKGLLICEPCRSAAEVAERILEAAFRATAAARAAADAAVEAEGTGANH